MKITSEYSIEKIFLFGESEFSWPIKYISGIMGKSPSLSAFSTDEEFSRI